MTFAAEILLALVPGLLLFAALVLGRYPGERTLVRIATRGRTRRPRRAPRAIAPKPRAPLVAVRAGELLARSLATRPPPPLLTA